MGKSTVQSKDYYKLGAAGVAVIYAIYSAFSQSIGNSLFSIIIAILLLLSEPKFAPRKIAESARRLFYGSDKLARAFAVVLGIGGSALIIDIVYGLDFLQDWLDVWVKRLAPALILICIALYVASLISKKIFQLSEINKDSLVRSYELTYYLLVIAFIISVAVFFIGLPTEQIIPTSRKHDPVSLNWGKNQIKAFGVFISICVVWKTIAVLCIFSRYFEWSWMIRLIKKQP